jgi:CCR4-NOT transcription complex subunit 4
MVSSTQRKRGSATTRSLRPQTETRLSTRTHKLSTKQEISSRPSTPAPTLVPHPSLPPKPPSPVAKRKESTARVPSPASVTVDTGEDSESGSQDNVSASSELRPQSADPSSIPAAPPGLPAVPPGLSAPPGLPGPSQPPRVSNASPQTPILAQQTTYQMSTAARALLDDVTSRREAHPPNTVVQSPFPDFDRTLENLSQSDSGFGGFSFNLDMKLAGGDAVNDEPLVDLEPESQIPFLGASFMDAFPALRSTMSTPSSSFGTPPGLPYPHSPAHAIFDPSPINGTVTPIETQSSNRSNYMGSFNPFADGTDETSATSVATTGPAKHTPVDDDTVPRVSRFGFARQGPRAVATTASSPLQLSSTLSSSSNNETNSIFSRSEPAGPYSPAISQWSLNSRQPLHQEFGYAQTNSAAPSPMMAAAQAQTMYPPRSRFQPFDSSEGVSEAQLRDFIQNSQDRPGMMRHDSQGLYKTGQQFQDPAIMSVARFASASESNYLHHSVDMGYGPPPGLSFPPGLQNLSAPVGMNDGNNSHGESHSFSSEGRVACVPSCRAFSAEDL